MIRGLATGSLAVALLLAAALLGSVAFFAFAFGLLVAVLGALAVTMVGARRLVVERTIDQAEVLEGRPLSLRFRVAGLRRLPVHAEVLGDDGSWQRLEGSSSRRCTIERPGAHLIGPSTVRVRDDLSLFSRRRSVGDPTVVLVLPAPASVAIEKHPPGAILGGDPEPDGLQPYSPGTPVARIYWPSVARPGAGWQERRVVTAPRGLPLVVVDLAGAASEAAVDWTLRMAAGQIHGLACAGGCHVLLPGERFPLPVENTAEGWPTVHRRLANLRSAARAGSPSAPPGAIHVKATQAPPLDGVGPRRLPPEVVPLEESTFGHVAYSV